MINYLVDEFVTVAPGGAYRLLPFGPIVKGGKRRVITAEFAKRFKLPHFKPPIKLGSHEDTTAAGGQIVALEVRADGLYAITELTPKGQQVFNDGDYRYHSPEVIWEDGALEHPETGDMIEGPFIVGDALLHTPHLGEATAFYTIEETTSMETVTVPTSWLERFLGRNKDDEQPTPPPQPDTTQLTAVQAERDNYAAQVAEYQAEVERLKAEQQHGARIAHFTAELKGTALADNADLHTLLAGIDNETADKLLIHFKALSAQADEVTRQVGGDSDPDVQGQSLNDLAIAYSIEHKTDYNTALERVLADRPELYQDWRVNHG